MGLETDIKPRCLWCGEEQDLPFPKKQDFVLAVCDSCASADEIRLTKELGDTFSEMQKKIFDQLCIVSQYRSSYWILAS